MTWSFNGHPVKPSESITSDYYEDGTVSLSLSVMEQADSGEYICEAQNRNGVSATVTQLMVEPLSTNTFLFKMRFKCAIICVRYVHIYCLFYFASELF